MYSYLLWTEDSPLQLFNSTLLIFDDSPFLFLNNFFNILRFHLSCLSYGALLAMDLFNRVFNNSELKGAHFRILPKKVPILTKNVRFLYYRQANKKRHPPLKVAPMCYKVHVIEHSGSGADRQIKTNNF